MKLHGFLEEIVVFDEKFKDFGPWGFDQFDWLFCQGFLGVCGCFRRISFDIRYERVEFFLILLGSVVEDVFLLVWFRLILFGFGVGIGEGVVD